MRARKIDANHRTIATYFEKLGCLVHHTIGDWDLTVCKGEAVRLVEVKDPQSKHLARRNKGDDLIDKGFPIKRCLTLEDVLRVAKEMR